MALFKMLFVQPHLVEGGQFGKRVTNKTARLGFAAVFRACYERTEPICKDFEQLDDGPAPGLDYLLQKEKFPIERKRIFVSRVGMVRHLPHANTCSTQLA